MHAMIVSIAIVAASCILMIINLIVATHSIRYSWYFSNFVIISISIMLSVSTYDRLSFSNRAQNFAESFVALQDQNVRLSDGLILSKVGKNGWEITYRYIVDGAPQIPTMRQAVADNCRNIHTRILLEYGFTIIHYFENEKVPHSEIKLNYINCNLQ